MLFVSNWHFGKIEISLHFCGRNLVAFFFFLSFRNKRKKGRSKVYLGDERKEDSFFLIGGGEGFSSANKTDLEKELEGINLLT